MNITLPTPVIALSWNSNIYIPERPDMSNTMMPLMRERFVVLRQDHPASFYATTALLFLGLIFAFLIEYFKPIGKRRLKSGQRSKLPPGPRGLPLIGNLHKLKHARHDPDHRYVSQTPPNHQPPKAQLNIMTSSNPSPTTAPSPPSTWAPKPGSSSTHTAPCPSSSPSAAAPQTRAPRCPSPAASSATATGARCS